MFQAKIKLVSPFTSFTMNLNDIEQIIGYVFKDKSTLKTAFTHVSFAKEHQTESNERLEFLGDAVLNFLVADMLYSRSIVDEGTMSVTRAKIVSRQPLSHEIERLNLLPYLFLGTGFEIEKTTSDKFKSNLFEAVTGAVYIDGGLEAAREFVKRTLIANIKKGEVVDYKTKLQEVLQARSLTVKDIIYQDETVENVPPEFVSRVIVSGKIAGEGTGNSKKKAQQEAAKKALEVFES